jgi:hypothetical protein
MKLNKAPIPAANPGPSFVSGVRKNRQHTTKYGSNSTIARSPKPGVSIPGRKNGSTSRIPQTRSRTIKRRIEGETCSSKAFGVVGVLFICYASLHLAALLRFLRWPFFQLACRSSLYAVAQHGLHGPPLFPVCGRGNRNRVAALCPCSASLTCFVAVWISRFARDYRKSYM